MQISIRDLFLSAAFALLLTAAHEAHAQQTPDEPAVETPAPADATADDPAELEVESEARSEAAAQDSEENDRRRRHDRVIVHFGDDSRLPAGEAADAVISIFGSSTSEGDVREAVVSVFGDTRVTGPVGENVVSVFGSTYINNSVGDETVAVFGDIELGPRAAIGGDVVAVGGRVIRDPNAIVEGGIQEISFGEGVGRLEWLRPWFEHALLYGRPLALEPGLGWAWGVAFVFLALYVLLAILFGGAVQKCVDTLETQPGQSALAALLSVLLTPVLFMLLLITVIGVMLVPFVGLALFCAGLFGKAVVLAWIGRRVMRFTGVGAFAQVAFPVLVGGVVMLGIYLVPVLGFIVYKLAGILGLGVVIYTILLAIRARRVSTSPAFAPATGGGGAPVEAARMSTDESAARLDSTPPEPAVGAAVSLPRAGFWIRMVALLIDAVLVGVIVSILEPPGEIWLLALAGYGALMWKLKSTTIGGIVCNLQVVRVDGREIDWDTSIVRALSCFLSLAAAGLGFLWIAFDPDRQSWHDKIAGTVVVRVQRAGARGQ
ncbi:MAG: RDD family protein [Steroidobacter sp.]